MVVFQLNKGCLYSRKGISNVCAGGNHFNKAVRDKKAGPKGF